MSAFAKTRACHGIRRPAQPDRTDPVPRRLRARTARCVRGRLADRDGQLPVTVAGLLWGVVLATRELAGPTWLEASCENPDITAFIALQATASPPDPARIDEICSRVLWARFAPARAAGAGADDDETGAGPPAHGSEQGEVGHARLTG